MATYRKINFDATPLDIIILLDYYTERMLSCLKSGVDATFYARHAAHVGKIAIELGFIR